jgi:hypothetical protein
MLTRFGPVGTALLAVALGVASAPTSAAEPQEREVIVKPLEPRPDVLFLAGRVKPDYARQRAILQRRTCGASEGGCAWFGVETFRTDARSRFKRSVPDLEPGRRKACYRVKVPGGRGFAAAYSEVNCIGPVS